MLALLKLKRPSLQDRVYDAETWLNRNPGITPYPPPENKNKKKKNPSAVFPPSSYTCFSDCGGGGGGGHSNTSVVHIRDQSFSKHTLIKIYPFEEKYPKQEFTTILHLILTPKPDFWGEHVWWNRGVWKITPKIPHKRIKKGPFFLKIRTFWPLILILENHIQSQKTTLFCVSLVVHVYNTSIQVAPPGLRHTPPQALLGKLKYFHSSCSLKIFFSYFSWFTGTKDLHLLESLSLMERNRQGRIHELISKEEVYVEDLRVAVEVGQRAVLSCECKQSRIRI